MGFITEDELIKEFPFDVINLDFTSSLLRTERDNFKSLERIFILQRGQGFLLFITSRPDPTKKDIFLPIISGNLENEPDFLEAYKLKYKSDDPNACFQDYTEFEQLAIPKLVARLARDFGYKIIEPFVSKYHRDNFDLVSHSFEVQPIDRRVIQKRYEPKYRKNLSQDTVEKYFGEEISSSTQQKLIKEYGEFIQYLPLRENVLDINKILDKNQDLRIELKVEVKKLIEWINGG